VAEKRHDLFGATALGSPPAQNPALNSRNPIGKSPNRAVRAGFLLWTNAPSRNTLDAIIQPPLMPSLSRIPPVFSRIRIPLCLLSASLVVYICRGDETKAQPNHPDKTPLVFTEAPLGKITESTHLGELKVSPDNAHLAYSLQRGTNWSIALDGVEQGHYDQVRDLVFSPDSRHLAFAARRGSETQVVLDGKEGPPFKVVAKGFETFSPDSQHLAYIAWQETNWVAVLDVQAGKPYERIGKSGIIFSPDSKHFAYPAMRKKDCFMVVDGREGILSEGPGPFRFSPDGQHTGYMVPQGDDWLVVIDNQPKVYARVVTDGVLFSPDGRRSLYAAAPATNSPMAVFLDSKKQADFDSIGAGGMVFSPDSKHVALAGKRGNDWWVEVDGVKRGPYDGVMANSLLFSPDSAHLAYGASRSNQWFVVLDDQRGADYEGIVAKTLSFSPNSHRLGFLAGRAGSFIAVVDGVETPAAAINLIFGPDSRHVAWIAGEGTHWQVWVDGNPGRTYDGVSLRPFLFSPDSRNTWFVGARAGKFILVIGDQESKPYDQVLIDPAGSSSFHPFQVIVSNSDGKGGQEFLKLTAQ
jgi:hypothetical protein